MQQGRPAKNLSLYLAALVMDTAFFAALATLPFFVKRAGVLYFSDAVLGLLLAVCGLAYSVGAILLPRLLAGFDPVHSTRCCGALGGLLFFVASYVTDPLLVFLTLGLGRAALGGFWPTLMAMVGAGAVGDLGARIARFNTWWGSGKAVAFLVCGSLLDVTGDPAVTLRVAAAVMALAVLFVRSAAIATNVAAAMASVTEGAIGTHRLQDHESRDASSRVFVTALVAVGLGATIAAIWESQFPKGLGVLRFGSSFGTRYELGVNALLFSLYGGQALCFFVLRAWRAWPQSRSLLPGATLLLVIGQGLAVLVPTAAACALGLALSGVAFGCYFSKSLWLAQSGRHDAARRSGIHESALSIGAVIGPPLAGLTAVVSGRLELPFYAALALAGLTLVVVCRRLSVER